MLDKLKGPVRMARQVRVARLVDHLHGLSNTRRLGGTNGVLKVLRGGRAVRASPDVTCELDRFTVFDGSLQVSGRLLSEGQGVIAVGVRPPGRRWSWPEPGLSADDAPGDKRSGVRWRFAFSVPCPDGSVGVSWILCVVLADGSCIDINGARDEVLVTNDFARTFPAFWSELGRQATGALLEVGSRARSQRVNTESLPPGWSYVGFDIAPGTNVDVVGDAHDLSQFFSAETFDGVFSMATFEHLAMPWKVVVEINRILKPGGLVYVGTHQTWPVHDAPWDFWRFSSYSWAALFNERTGFRIETCGMGEVADVVPRIMHEITSGVPGVPAYLGSAVLARKIAPTTLSWDVPAHVVTTDNYPA